VGAVSAYFGGWPDAVLMRLADLVIMMPTISLLIVLGALFNLNFFTLAIAIGLISGLGGTAVIVKSQALTVKVKPYIEAARGAGGSHLHIILTHLVPNLVPLAFLYMMFTVTTAIFSEAVLSFFGILNIRMSWGIMIFTAQASGYLGFGLDYWWLLIPAGVSITLLCGSFYLVGRGLDPVVNPRLRSR
jgi:ABC-type dipeptide/oligopeptide/nickel transport system permease subunit